MFWRTSNQVVPRYYVKTLSVYTNESQLSDSQLTCGHLLPQKSHRGGLVHPRSASFTFGPVLLGCVSSVNVTNQWQPSTRWWRKSNFPLNGFSFIAARVSRSRNTAALHSGYQRFLKQMLQSELSKVKKKNKLAPSIGFD